MPAQDHFEAVAKLFGNAKIDITNVYDDVNRARVEAYTQNATSQLRAIGNLLPGSEEDEIFALALKAIEGIVDEISPQNSKWQSFDIPVLQFVRTAEIELSDQILACENDTSEIFELSNAFKAALLFELRDKKFISPDDAIQISEHLSPGVFRSYTQYKKKGLTKNAGSEESPSHLIYTPDGQTVDLEKTLERLETKLQMDRDATIQAVNESQQAIFDSLEKDYLEYSRQLRGNIHAALEGIREEGILRQAFELWQVKEDDHRRNFRTGIIAFIASVFGVGIVTYFSWMASSSITFGLITDASVKDGGSIIAAAQLLKTAVVFYLPLGIGVWILRAILRWTTLNLSLAEDAAQRSVTAQTYVNLLAEGKIEQDADRHIMLSALFRPLPGVKEVDIAPTTLLDIVKQQKPPTG